MLRQNSLRLIAFNIALVSMPIALASELVFEEDFNGLVDWTSTRFSTSYAQVAGEGDLLPGSWDSIYQGTMWSPELGFPDKHASLEILAENAEKAMENSGKSAVFWRESMSRGWKNWASDAQFIKIFDNEYDELYVEFFIKFSENWWQRASTGPWTSKIFRVGSYSGQGPIFNGAGGEVGPRMFWDYKRDQYGVRNVIGLYEGPHGAKGKTSSGIKGSLNYISSTEGMGALGTDPLIPDLVNDGYLIDSTSPISHEQIYGNTDRWTKLSFYVKMNSAPGVNDGVLKQWINDVQFHTDDTIAWVTDDEELNPNQILVGWNYIAIGGNDYFQAIDNDQRFEDWYAIDNFKVFNGIPNAPAAPSDVIMTY